MVTITPINGQPVRMDLLRLEYIDQDSILLVQTPSLLVFDLGDGYVSRFTGTNLSFAYDFEDLASFGGLITGFEQTHNGNLVFRASGMSGDAGEFFREVIIFANGTGEHFLFPGGDLLIGSEGDDVMATYFGRDTLFGHGGDDVLIGGIHSYISGGSGADTIRGGSGNNHLYGQSSNGGDDGDDRITGGDGNDYIHGNAGNDYLEGSSGSDRIFGGAGNDWIDAGTGNDTVNGNKGNDLIYGESGNDSLRGGQGNDLIVSGSGNDIMIGDLGNDMLASVGSGLKIMSGGEGADLFLFLNGYFGGTLIEQGYPELRVSSTVRQADLITDYEDGTDRIGLSFRVDKIDHIGSFDNFAEVQQAVGAPEDRNRVSVGTVNDQTFIYWIGDFAQPSAISLGGVDPRLISLDDFLMVPENILDPGRWNADDIFWAH